ncbi:CheY-like chemotaxis protein [Candidatus Symbiobacter mobilis CR]|uniref:CheY-like chemotaxis protein n=2 Tax=Candidatus Symbiobacter TaxID=1436289 RepID=U5N6P5_9BURK|nr:CheY-like chemotaxis protein [Candidatus Symbiobacter mobilis CR]
MLRDFVKYMGVHQIDTANSGRDAISHLSSSRYDIVICDFNLGQGPNGQQVLEEAKMRNLVGVSTIWVMVTAEKTPDMVMGAAETRPDDYLLKPINQVLLQSRIEKLLARKQSLGVIEASIRSQDYAAAIAHCDKLLQSQAVNPQEVLRIKSDLLLTVGDDASARELFEVVLAQRNVSWAKTGLGKVLFNSADYEGAALLFSQVLTDNPMYIEAADWLAKSYQAMGNMVMAQQVLLEATKLSPNSPMRQKALGDVAYRNGELDVAKTAFEKTIKIGEFSAHKSPAAYARLADVLSDSNEAMEALHVLKRSKADFRFNPIAALQTATVESRVYQKMGQSDMARAALANAEQLANQLGSQLSADLMIDLAKSHLQLGDKHKAFQLLGEVVKNNHENAELSGEVEHLLVREHLAEEGHALIEASRKEVIDINNQGVLFAKQGDFQQGLKLLRSAVKRLPSSEVMIVNLCGLLIAQMSKEGYREILAAEVRDLLNRVHAINPSNKKYFSYTQVLAKMQRGA